MLIDYQVKVLCANHKIIPLLYASFIARGWGKNSEYNALGISAGAGVPQDRLKRIQQNTSMLKI